MVRFKILQGRELNGFQRLRTLGVAAERLLFSLDDRHWTNSFALWMVLNGIDSALTWQSLSIGGHEMNPFLSVAAQTHSEGVMLIGKVVLALLIGVLVWRWGSRRLKSALNLGMNLVVLVNCFFLLRPMWLLHF